MKEHQESFSKQMPKNLIANMLYLVLNVAIGLFLVPFFIDELGVASYGLIPLATSLTSYVNLVTQSLNGSISRYLTIDLQKQDYDKANITFNTSLFGTLGITLLTIPIILIISYYSPLFFDIPVNQRQDACVLFIGIMGALLVRTWANNFGISLFAYNRLDLQNIINSINVATQTIFIIMLFLLYSPKLSYVGYSYLLSSLLCFLITVVLSKKVNPHFKVNIYDFKRSRLKDLMATGGWIVVDQIGTLLLFQMDIIVVNKLFGTSAGGEYSVILMWNTLIRTIAGMLAGILTPVILTYYARKKFEELLLICKSAVKIMGMVMALPIGLICGFSPVILSLWVGPDFVKLYPLMWILLIHLSINMAVLPLFSINVSYNKVRIPAIFTILSGVINLLLALLLPALTGWGYYGVALAGAIILTVRHFFFVPMYATRILGISKNPFKTSLIQVLLLTLAVAGIANILHYFLDTPNIIIVIIYCGAISSAYLFVMWVRFLNGFERKIIELFMPSKIRDVLKNNVSCD